MRLRLLGPVELSSEKGTWPIGPPQRRGVLAAVAADVGHAVPVDVVIDRVWGSVPPAGARSALYAHVARLRRVLTAAAKDTGVQLDLTRGPAGYRLAAGPGVVDVDLFHDLAQRARIEQRLDQRAGLLDKAIGLWQGEPLAELEGEWADRQRAAWRQDFLEVLIRWAYDEIEMRHADVVIGRLAAEVAEHPLVEPLSAALMDSLGAAGRGAEGLIHYATTAQLLADQLGTFPGPELQRAHQALLQPHVEAGPPSPLPPRTVPRQLPAEVSAFVGRDRESDALDARKPDPAGSTPVLCLVSGTAGVGKTALTVRWAHRAAADFPDGQLYLDLRGYDADAPVAPSDAVSTFLGELGVSGANLPLDITARFARYRSILAEHRMLVLLDNAVSADQVRPLLPGRGPSMVIVTSRDRLPGLVARDGAHRLEIDLLTAAQGLGLLRAVLGARVDEDVSAAVSVVQRCGNLPLALRIACEWLLSRPEETIGGLADELADEAHRLDVLATDGDVRATVSTVFSWSYRQLTASTAATFRMLSHHPGVDFPHDAVAALAAVPAAEARARLDALVRSHLLRRLAGNRFQLHDLLRAYARDRAAAEDSAEQQQAVRQRLAEYYVSTATLAADIVHPGDGDARPAGTDSSISDADSALALLTGRGRTSRPSPPMRVPSKSSGSPPPCTGTSTSTGTGPTP